MIYLFVAKLPLAVTKGFMSNSWLVVLYLCIFLFIYLLPLAVVYQHGVD